MDGIDHDQRRIGSAVFGRRGAGWRPQRSPAGAEGRGPTAQARPWADDEVRADPSDCAEAIPDRRARRRARGEDDARPDGGVSCRWRANRNPSLRQLLAPFPPRASRPQPQDRYDDVTSGQARPKFQTGQEAARTCQSRVSWAARNAAARGRIRGSKGALRPVTQDRRSSCVLMHYFMGLDHERCSPAPWKRRSGPRRGLMRSGNEPVPGFCNAARSRSGGRGSAPWRSRAASRAAWLTSV